MASILVADADDAQRLEIQKALQDVGHQVDAVKSGAAAVQAMKDAPADLLILDLILFDTPGHVVVDKLVQNGVLLNRPVLLCTAVNAWGIRHLLGPNRKVCRLLRKPFNADDLRSTVEAALLGTEPQVHEIEKTVPSTAMPMPEPAENLTPGSVTRISEPLNLRPSGIDAAFGNYQLLRRLKIGGMGEVFLATRKGEGQQLVIKTMSPDLAAHEAFADMFMDEARLSAILEHPNVVKVLDFGRVGPTLFIAMEYVDGNDLETIGMALDWAFSPVLAAYIMAETLAALAYAHRKTDKKGDHLYIVHRDVNPPNILISTDGRIMLTDFGIATAARRYSRGTDRGDLRGKHAYMSPEQIVAGPVDHRADIFAAGVVLYRLLTGRVPFEGSTSFETMQKVKDAECPPPSVVNDQVPDALDHVVMTALARDRNARYNDAESFEAALRDFVGTKELAKDPRDVLAHLVVRTEEITSLAGASTSPGDSGVDVLAITTDAIEPLTDSGRK